VLIKLSRPINRNVFKMFEGWVFGVKLSDEDIADFKVLKDVAKVTVFGFQYMGCTLTPPLKFG